MAKLSLVAPFRDPVRRPRAIVWTGVALLAFAAFLVVALGVASTSWFCSQVCHAVMVDAKAAYDASSHSEVSCLACHIPVNADPVTFVIHKLEAGIDGTWRVATGEWELPVNPRSELSGNAVKFPDRQCTQCHSLNRKVTPSNGIVIDHAIHAEKGVTCTTCHNRVAHADAAVTPPLPVKRLHRDNMRMDGCFRCHGLTAGSKAPGACDACHAGEFDLKPPSHDAPGFYRRFGDSKGHAAAAKADVAEIKAGTREVSYCETCHVRKTFCDACHGLPMPHPGDFSKGHGGAGKRDPKVCANCHARSGAASATGTRFCDSCHHKEADPTRPWISQHWQVVREKGAPACFKCHRPAFCSHCHVSTIRK